MYRVSVIMPIDNNEDTLSRAIESLLKQSIYGVELILVNDGSTDASAQICEDYAKKEPLLVEVIHQKKSGAGAARNRGLVRATGEYVYFANPKDTFDSKMLEANLSLADEKNADLVVFGFKDTSQLSLDGGFQHYPRIPHLSDQEAFRNHYRNFHQFFPYALHNKIYRRSYLVKNRNRFPHTPWNEAAFFNLGVFKHLQSVAFNRATYCQHNSSQATKGYQKKLFEVRFKLALYLEEMLAEWGQEDEYRDLIVLEFFSAVHLEIENLCLQPSAYTIEEQENRIQRILSNEKIHHALNDPQFPTKQTPFLKGLRVALQNGNSRAALQLASQRKETQKGTYKLSQWLRNLISR